MTLNPIRPNMTEVTVGNDVVLFNYSTPVAIKAADGMIYRTDCRWSATTTRHINLWLKGYMGAILKPQTYFNNYFGGAK